MDHRVGVGDGRLGLEVSRAAVINNNKVRLDHFVNNIDRALVTSIVAVITVDTLLSHNNRGGSRSPPDNVTNFVTNFKVSLWFSHHDNLPHSASMVMMILTTVAGGSG